MSLQFSFARQQLYQLTRSKSFNLAEASLYIAMEEYPTLDFDRYLEQLDGYAEAIRTQLPAEFYPLKIIQIINQYLFKDLGFQGNQSNYYDPCNSYLNQVLDRRMGIPISLSLIYLEVARRIGFPMIGVNFPGHFLIRPVNEDIQFFVDPFFGGDILFLEDCRDRLQAIMGQAVDLQAQFFQPISPQGFLLRMLNNLKHLYLQAKDLSRALTTLEQILIIDPTQTQELRTRGILYYQTGRRVEASQDLREFVQVHPEGANDTVVQQLLQQLEQTP